MKNRSTRLQNKVKAKVSVRQRMRMVAAAGALALGVFSAALIFNMVGDSKQSNAHTNARNGYTETLPDFKWRIPIEIEKEELPNQKLYNFPLMVSLSDPDLRSVANGGKVISNEGNDIYFTSADGISVLDFEIEKYNPKTGECVAWVRMDSILPKQSNKLFMYFSNKNAANGSTRDAWNNSYKGVWHLKGLLSSKNPYSNAYAQKPANAKETRELYIASERNSSRFLCMNSPEDVNITSELTLSAWVYLDNVKDEQIIVTNQLNKQGGYALKVKNKHLTLSVCDAEGNVAEPDQNVEGTQLEKGRWYHVAATYSDIKDSLITYINGEVDRKWEFKSQLALSKGFMQIGRAPELKQYYFDGAVEEVRVKNVFDSAAWLETEFINQSEPKRFLSIGKPEQVIQLISSTILGFEAEQSKNSVVLKWITSNEEELDKFIVERSIDGVNYDPLVNKPAAGNSAELLSYQFRDEKPVKGYSYYRIRVSNNLGNEEFSMVTPVKFEPESELLLSIKSAGPNPFSEQFTVDYVAPKPGKIKVKLQNISKEVLMEKELSCEGKKVETFQYAETAHLNPGIYYLTFQQGDDSKMVKLVKKAG
jgi:hypothetical protein